MTTPATVTVPSVEDGPSEDHAVVHCEVTYTCTMLVPMSKHTPGHLGWAPSRIAQQIQEDLPSGVQVIELSYEVEMSDEG